MEHPELIVVGLPGDRAHRLLNEAGARVRDGMTFRADSATDLLIPEYSCAFRKVPDVQFEYFIGAALQYYDGAPFPCLQLVWPARDGCWPWSDAASGIFREQQRIPTGLPVPPWPEPVTER